MSQFDELDEIEKHDEARIEECHELVRWNKIQRDKRKRKSILEEYWGDGYRKRIDDENNRNKPKRVSDDYRRLI